MLATATSFFQDELWVAVYKKYCKSFHSAHLDVSYVALVVNQAELLT